MNCHGSLARMPIWTKLGWNGLLNPNEERNTISYENISLVVSDRRGGRRPLRPGENPDPWEPPPTHDVIFRAVILSVADMLDDGSMTFLRLRQMAFLSAHKSYSPSRDGQENRSFSKLWGYVHWVCEQKTAYYLRSTILISYWLFWHTLGAGKS